MSKQGGGGRGHVDIGGAGTTAVDPAGSHRQVFIYGDKSFPTSMLAYFIEANMDAECHVGSNLVSFLKGAAPDTPPLILIDARGRDRDELFETVHTLKLSDQREIFSAIYNIDRGSDLENAALEYGVRGFFYAEDQPEKVLKGIQAIFNGELWVSRRKMTECLLARPPLRNHDTSSAVSLTPREKDILALISAGSTNEAIADHLCISLHTVKTHVHNIFRKIGVHNRLQAALWAAGNL